MSLPVTFHRAASAEFIEASAWYETKRSGLALEFIAEIDRCVSLASKVVQFHGNNSDTVTPKEVTS